MIFDTYLSTVCFTIATICYGIALITLFVQKSTRTGDREPSAPVIICSRIALTFYILSGIFVLIFGSTAKIPTTGTLFIELGFILLGIVLSIGMLSGQKKLKQKLGHC